MSVFVVLIAIAVGLVAALAFRTANPDTPLIILGGSFLSAGLLALIGLYRYKWFLFATLALRPALDDLTADEFGSFPPSAILGILVIGVSALHLISRRATGNWRRMTPMSWAMIGFLLAFAPSYLLSVDRGVSQAAMFGLASVVLLYLAMEHDNVIATGRCYQLLGQLNVRARELALKIRERGGCELLPQVCVRSSRGLRVADLCAGFRVFATKQGQVGPLHL